MRRLLRQRWSIFGRWRLRIKRTIRRQTGGGVNGLKVEIDGETVRLLGTCPTFYCKQLAQQAAMRIAKSSLVENLIVVQESA